MSLAKLSLPFLILLLAVAACSLPFPGPDEATQAPEAATSTAPPETGPTQDGGGGGGEGPGAEPTQHDVFAPSIQSGEQEGGTPAPGGEAETPSAESTEQRIFAPAIESGGEGGGGEPSSGSGLLDPHVEIQASKQTLAVGETITVTGRPVDIQAQSYALSLRDEGVQDAAPVVEVDTNNQQTAGSGSSQFLELVSVQAGPDQVVFVLRGLAQGVATLTITASGQVSGAEGGSVEGSGAGEIILTVEP